MTDHAQTAVENAFRLEAKKDRLTQRQSGDWTITFTVSPLDMPNGLLTAPMGTRFMLAACEIADDETPVVQPEAAKATPAEGIRKPDLHRLSRQAAMLGTQLHFQNFLLTKGVIFPEEGTPTDYADCAAIGVRELCRVQSRAEFDDDPEAAKRWRALHASYLAWQGVGQ